MLSDCYKSAIGIREWFRWYKTPDGKPINGFGHDEKCLDASKVTISLRIYCVDSGLLCAGTRGNRRDPSVLGKLAQRQSRSGQTVGR